MKKLILAAAIALVSTTDSAESIENEFFKDWISLNKLMRAEGIDPIKTNWFEIENRCLGLKKIGSTDETQYNRCRYQYARAQRDYNAQSSGCRSRADDYYPVYLDRRKPFRTYVETNSDGTKKTMYEFYEPVYQVNYKKLRNGVFEDCMMARGWNDPYSWLGGRELPASY